MDKEKRNVCFVLTILGVILIVVIQTIISLDDEAEEKGKVCRSQKRWP